MSTSLNPLKTAMLDMQNEKSEASSSTAVASHSLAPPSRQGKKVVSGHFDPLAARQLKLLAAEQDRSIQSLLEEALNDLFRKYNKSSIA